MALRPKSVFASLFIFSLLAIPTAAVALDDTQKQEFGAFIREYLMANPEILEEMQNALEIKKQDEQSTMARMAISANADAIFREPADAVLGNPIGDVTIVEFFDYNCGFCKRAMDDMTRIIGEDSNVRFVLKEFPILGPDSLAAHRVSMAFHSLLPHKYSDFHVALLGGDVRATEDRAIEIALSMGVDEAELRKAMEAPAVDASIRNAYELANALGISGTPSYIIGDEAVFGAMGAEVLMSKISNFRTCKSTIC